MNRILKRIAVSKKHSIFHLVCIVLALQSIVIIFTATDLGPFAPLFVACGFYVAIFSILLELTYWISLGMQNLAGRLAK